MTYHDYSGEQKAEVLSLIQSGESRAKIAAQTGIPESTIRGWQAGSGSPGREIRTKKNMELARRLREKVDMFVEAMTPDKAKDSYLQSLTTATGTSIDKILLLEQTVSPEDIGAFVTGLFDILQDRIDDSDILSATQEDIRELARSLGLLTDEDG